MNSTLCVYAMNHILLSYVELTVPFKKKKKKCRPCTVGTWKIGLLTLVLGIMPHSLWQYTLLIVGAYSLLEEEMPFSWDTGLLPNV